jgi:acyl-CoA thioester hydrolase
LIEKMTSAAEFIWPIRVYYEDTDSGGVVYYANYLKFMERARTEWLRSLGFEQDQLAEQNGIVFAVRKVEMDFISPARFNDALEVKVGIVERKRASMTFRQEITNTSSGRILCSGKVQVASVDAATFRPRPIPEPVLKELPDVQ